MTSIIDFSGLTRIVTKTVSVVTKTVQPVTNVIEIATNSSQAWTENHAANLASKTERDNATREILSAAKLRKAKASAQRQVLATEQFVRDTQIEVDVDSFKGRIHQTRRAAIHNINDETVLALATKDNLTDSDIIRAAKIGSITKPSSEDEVTSNDFDLSQFTPAQ